MTDFLRLNGITVPVAVGSADVTQEDIGSSKRASDGTPLYNRRAVKRTWSSKTVITTAAEARAWRDLVTGKGHVLNWESNNHYTSKGLAPTTLQAGFTIAATGAKYGTYRGKAVNSNLAGWPMFAASPAPWSVAVWYSPTDGGAYTHYLVRSDGAKWVDGVRNDAASTTFLSVNASGVMFLSEISGAGTASFDDVVGLPFLVPTTWPTQIYAFGSAFGALPRLTADGLFIEGNTATTVKGAARSLKVFNVQAARDYHDFAFELLEV